MIDIYLAVPYSHPDPEVREARFEAANRYAAWLIGEGYTVFSPISHSHPIALNGIPAGFRQWRNFDEAILSICEKVVVLMLDGWEQSEGLKKEIAQAKAWEIGVVYTDGGSVI